MTRNHDRKKPTAAKYGCLVFLTSVLLLTSHNINAQSSKWAAPKEADNAKNPLSGNTEILQYAKVIYATYCGPCHGSKGKGDGVAAAGLQTKPADHSSDYVQKQTDGALFWMISEGHNPMPAFKNTLTENQRWELVNYIRTLAKNPKK